MNEELLVDARMRTLCMLSGPTIHELRGAANVLALHLQLLSLEATDDEAIARRERSLAAADEGRRRLFDLAEAFVRLAALPDLHETAFDLARVTGDAVALARPYAAQRRIDLVASLASTPIAVQGRRDVVLQTVLDLLVALLERLPGGSRVDVAVEPHGDGQATVRMTASDAALDAALVARATAAMEWSGGTLRVGDGSIEVRLPGAPPGEVS
jgi:signal transduction histidine kinase